MIVDKLIKGILIDSKLIKCSIVIVFVLVYPDFCDVWWSACESEIRVAVYVKITNVNVLFLEFTILRTWNNSWLFPVVVERSKRWLAKLIWCFCFALKNLEGFIIGYDDLVLTIIVYFTSDLLISLNARVVISVIFRS